MHYLKDEAETQIPIWRMIAMRTEAIQERAAAWAQILRSGEVISGESTVGGGSLPGETLPTFLLALDVRNPDRFMKRLRQSTPPVIARLDNDRILFDPRTVLPEQEQHLLAAIRRVFSVRPRALKIKCFHAYLVIEFFISNLIKES